MSVSGWIGVDLDGTLAEYGGWKGVDHIGKPVPVMLERVKKWIAEGVTVKIFTARVDGGGVALAMGTPAGEAHQDVDRVRLAIERWCIEHIGVVLPITNQKDYGMIELWDDRCIHVEMNTGKSHRMIDPGKFAHRAGREVAGENGEGVAVVYGAGWQGRVL